jgi:AcrR family transcriptional regulator
LRSVAEQRSRARAEAGQLPAGRHGLPRGFVVHNQRERILNAVGQAVAAKGYLATSVQDVIEIAAVSRRTFYEHFTCKEDAFLTAYDVATAQLVQRVASALSQGDDLVRCSELGLEALLAFIVESPEFARMCLVEVLAAGPEAMGRRDSALQTMASLLHEYASEPSFTAPPLAAEAVVGAVYDIIYKRIAHDRLAELPGLLPDLLFAVLLPYLGRTRAGSERRRLLASSG